MFKAAKRALRSVRRRGMLAPEDAKSIRRTAFGKAQLDSDRTRLSTEAVTGIDGDIPIQPIQSALVKFAQNEAASPDEMQAARQAQEVQRAAAKPSAASAKSSSSGAPDLTPEIDEPDAPQGFLWKPYSESDGNLVVLLPPSWKGIQKAVIRTPNGNVYDGRNTGIHNGDRVHFRFSQPGREFPPGSTVEVTMNDGSVRKVTVQNTAYRVV